MRFRVTRASSYRMSEEAPCEGAERVDGEWWSEVKDLDALMALMNREGDLIVRNHSSRMGEKLFEAPDEIVIYDDYME